MQAQLTIGGVITLNGFIAITAAVDPTGTAYFKIDGAVGVSIPLLGASPPRSTSPCTSARTPAWSAACS